MLWQMVGDHGRGLCYVGISAVSHATELCKNNVSQFLVLGLISTDREIMVSTQHQNGLFCSVQSQNTCLQQLLQSFAIPQAVSEL